MPADSKSGHYQGCCLGCCLTLTGQPLESLQTGCWVLGRPGPGLAVNSKIPVPTYLQWSRDLAEDTEMDIFSGVNGSLVGFIPKAAARKD